MLERHKFIEWKQLGRHAFIRSDAIHKSIYIPTNAYLILFLKNGKKHQIHIFSEHGSG